jgi:hypothetical protein
MLALESFANSPPLFHPNVTCFRANFGRRRRNGQSAVLLIVNELDSAEAETFGEMKRLRNPVGNLCKKRIFQKCSKSAFRFGFEHFSNEVAEMNQVRLSPCLCSRAAGMK